MNRPVESLGGRLLPELDIEKVAQDNPRVRALRQGARGISDSASLGQPVVACNAWVSPGKDGERA